MEDLYSEEAACALAVVSWFDIAATSIFGSRGGVFSRRGPVEAVQKYVGSELTAAYNCVVLAYGSHSENYLNIPGEKSFSNLISGKQVLTEKTFDLSQIFK